MVCDNIPSKRQSDILQLEKNNGRLYSTGNKGNGQRRRCKIMELPATDNIRRIQQKRNMETGVG